MGNATRNGVASVVRLIELIERASAVPSGRLSVRTYDLLGFECGADRDADRGAHRIE